MTATTRWRHKQRERGLCRDCTQPAERGKLMCAKHAKKHSLNAQDYQEKLVAGGRCLTTRARVERLQKCLNCRRKASKHG